jgi:HK97 family phage prohead protease
MDTLKKSIMGVHTKDLGEGSVEVVVSTNSMDRHGEKLSIDGLDTSKYNGVVLLNHDYGSLPIGKSMSLRKIRQGDGEVLVSETKFAVDQYPLARTVYQLVRDGFMPDVSIGFIAKEWDETSNTWTKAEMIEYSHVTVGANADATVLGKALERIGKSQADFDEELKAATETPAEETVEVETVIEPDQIKSIRLDVEALLATAKALEAQVSAASLAWGKSTPQKRKIILVDGKKRAQASDRLVEALISKLNATLNQIK